jgi:hypothetical protein
MSLPVHQQLSQSSLSHSVSFRSRADGVSNASKLAGTDGGRPPSTRPGVYFVRRAGFHANPYPASARELIYNTDHAVVVC